MTGIELKVVGSVKKLSGPGSRAVNKFMAEKVMSVVMDQITDDIHTKAIEYARGIDTPEQRVPFQADHPIGQSPSEYSSTGALANSIQITYKEPTKAGKYRSIITASSEYASYTEWGTGKWGPLGRLIFPKKEGGLLVYPFGGKTVATSFIRGQPPNPFFRSSIWNLMDNFQSTKEKIEEKFRSMK